MDFEPTDSGPLCEPPGLYQRFMPEYVQQVLAAYSVTLPAFDILVNDDGTPVGSAEAVATYVANRMMDRQPTPFTADIAEVAGMVGAHFGRLEARGKSTTRRLQERAMDTTPDGVLTDEAILAHVKTIRGDDGRVTKQQRRLSVRALRKVDAERIAGVLGGVIEGDLLDALLGQR